MKKYIGSSLLLILLLLGGCLTDTPERQETEELIPVQAYETRLQTFSQNMTLSGQIRSEQDHSILSSEPLQVEHVHVQLGDEVNEGDPLMELIEPGDAYTRGTPSTWFPQEGFQSDGLGLQHAQSLLEGAQTGAVTMIELQQASYQLMLAQSPLINLSPPILTSGLGARYGQGIVYAPFSGVITESRVQEGSVVPAQQQLMQVSDLDQLVVELLVGPTQVEQLDEGMPARIWFENETEPVLSSIERISFAPSTATGNFQAQIILENENQLRFPGAFVRVEIETSLIDQALLVPVDAVFYQNNAPYVYLIVEERAQLTQVELGERNVQYYHVIQGLSEYDHVITRGKERVTDGRKVYVQ